MTERRFHRVKFSAPGDLRHQGMSYQVRLENLSMRGAMLSSDECIVIPEGEHCTISFRFESQDAPLVLTAEVIHTFFSMVGVQFIGFDRNAEQRLFEHLQKITSEPERLNQEWQAISQFSTLADRLAANPLSSLPPEILCPERDSSAPSP
jgi:hypothetical protein